MLRSPPSAFQQRAPSEVILVVDFLLKIKYTVHEVCAETSEFRLRVNSVGGAQFNGGKVDFSK